MQHLVRLPDWRRTTTPLASRGLGVLIVFTFAFMHAVVVSAGATCCIDEAIERADACEDQAQADSLAEAARCKRRILPRRIEQCLLEVHARHQERKDECRRIRDEEISQCNI